MIKRIKAKAPDRRQITPSEVWFEVPAENIGRASTFYTSLFGSKIGGMPGRPIVNWVGDFSLHELAARVEDLGGEVCLSKRAALQMGYFVICRDTEGQMFRLWETTATDNKCALVS
jgi:predicted enzyme related to lactoylglutathione lyase